MPQNYPIGKREDEVTTTGGWIVAIVAWCFVAAMCLAVVGVLLGPAD